jgi:hypothetical protein
MEGIAGTLADLTREQLETALAYLGALVPELLAEALDYAGRGK